MKWGGRGVGTERSEGWIQKDMEGSEISSSLRSLSSVRMNADSECAGCACVCLNLECGCAAYSVSWGTRMKRRSPRSVTVMCVLQLQIVPNTSKGIFLLLLNT